MRKAFESFLVLGFAFGGPAYADTRPTANSPGDPGLTVAVRVYDYARVPRGTLVRAGKETSNIFREVGIEARWLVCSRAEDEFQSNRGCEEPVGAADLHLIILARAGAESLAFRESELGRASVATQADKGAYARVFYIYYDRVSHLAEYGYATEANILALGIAHEIGHLLLSELGHSGTGIMSARLGPNDLRRLAKGDLLFSPDQAKKMRENVRFRMRTMLTKCGFPD